MRAAVALLLALCAALTLRVRPARRRLPEHPHSDQGHSQCEDSPSIIIIFISQHGRWVNGENKVSIAYGSSLEVHCNSPTNADKLTMTRSGEKLATEEIYPDTISTARIHLLTSKDVFVCTDLESTCTSSMIITATPVFEVISHHVQVYAYNHINYTVQCGEPLTMLCSGPDSTRLVMSQDGEPLQTELESNTTIKHFVKQPDLLISEYVCNDISTSYNSSVTIKVLPAVHVQSQNETITPIMPMGRRNGLQLYEWEYRNSDIEVNCCRLRPVKLIGRGEENIPFTENFINVTPHGVKYINKLKLGIWYFECSESQFPDYVISVKITIIPRMEVRSPNIRRVRSGADKIQYGIKYGDPIEIICSGTDSDELHITNDMHNAVGFKNKGIEETLNSTAIKYTLKDVGMYYEIKFQCSKQGCPECNALLSIGMLPYVADFRCVSHKGLILNCTWTAQSNDVNFTLSYVENAILTRICEKPRSSRKSKICVKEYDEYNSELSIMKKFVLLLQSCNNFGCSNRTFHINHLSIVKPDPVSYLRVRDITPRGAVLMWRGTSYHVAGEWLSDVFSDFHYRVQYWYSGIEPGEVNSSLITCSWKPCEIELNLPCPWQSYEVKVYQKLKGAVGEEFWSDPSSVSFHTVADEDTTIDDTCSWEPTNTSAVMKYFVEQNKKKVHLEMQAFKEKVISLKDQLDIIRALKQQGKSTP